MIVLWGSNARETHPIFFHHLLKGVRNGARLFVVDPRRTASAKWADTWLGLDVGTDIPLACAVAREIIHSGLCDEQFIARATDGLWRVRRVRRALHARRGRAADGRPGRSDPRARAHLRARRPGDHLLDARDHRAPHRRRQRAGADQPVAADRPRRALRLGAEPAARAEQRPGRRRHGRDPEQAAGLPGHRERRRGTRSVRARLRQADRPEVRLAPDRDVRGNGARRASHAVRHRREPGPLGGRRAARAQAAERSRLPDRAGHLPDRHGQARRRRPARLGLVGRGQRHRYELRAARPARAQGARSAGRCPRRQLDHHAARKAARIRLGRAVVGGDLERAADPEPDARRHELQATGRSTAACSGRASTRTIRERSSCTGGCGRTRSRAGRRRSASRRTARRSTSSTTSSRSA